MPRITHTSCPICNALEIRQVLTVKDFTVSGETFPVLHCNGCQARFTQGIPDAAEIGNYYRSESYISHTDTRKGLVNRLYHLVRSYTLGSKLRMVRRDAGMRTGTLLDYGSGTGAFLDTMRKGGWTVSGLEPDEEARARAKELHGLDLQGPENLAGLGTASFDAVTLWHVLEHVHDLHNTLDHLVRVLKPGGMLFIAVPNYTSGDAVHYGEYWAAWDVPRHLYHFSPSSMRGLLERHGMIVQGTRRMWFDSFYVSMLSERYKRGRGAILRAFAEGFLSNVQSLTQRDSCSSLIYLARKRKD
jgi:2-polyprenyl-3-methyl-5-hydroxy-6-metoxy-1,4-benzoquinol methylase